MERVSIYALVGCFVATLISLFLNSHQENKVILILLPMWGLVLGIAVARVVNSGEKTIEEKPKRKPKEIVLYSRKKK